MSRAYLVVLLGFIVAAVGCGSARPVISGTVTFNGEPLPSGTVLVHGGDGNVAHGLITDGKYTVQDAQPGPVRITVKSHPLLPKGLPSSARPPASQKDQPTPGAKSEREFVPIPKRYEDPEKSGLSYTVLAGKQTHDLKLVP